MARTRLHDDRAAYDLLAGVVRQCRKDLVRGAVKIEDRVSAVELFMVIGGLDADANTDAGREDCQQIRPARLGSGAGAAAAPTAGARGRITA